MNLEKQVLHTLTYFDIFGQPLTSFEVWKYLWSPGESVPINNILDTVENLIKNSFIDRKDGFYFLKDRAGLIELRKKRFQISKKKLDKAQRLSKIFQHIPYLRGIFVCNKVSQNIAEAGSDIDLFIITDAGRIWTVRFLTTIFLKFLGLRPRGDRKKDTFCLSFYISKNNLFLETYLLPTNDGWPDIHYIYWLADFLPIYDGGSINEFVNANNWIKKYLPNLELTANSSRLFSRDPKIKRFAELILNKSGLANFMEKIARRLQLAIMPKDLRSASLEPNTNVVISDSVLKFHLNDRREEYRQKFLINTKHRE